MALHLQGYSLGNVNPGSGFIGVGNGELICSVTAWPSRWTALDLSFKPRTISELVRVSIYTASSGSATGTSVKPLDQDFQYPTSGFSVHTTFGGTPADLVESYYIDVAKRPVLHREWRRGLRHFYYMVILNTYWGERYDVHHNVVGIL